MSRFEVDSAEVAQAAAMARTSAGAIRGEVTAMMGHLTHLQSSWSGQASAGFIRVADQWRGTQQLVDEALEQIGAALDAAAVTYEEAEAQAQRLFMG
ncbi:MAG TPA: WXG100 family type VII secretion target [Actinomycetaceae bacterium]|nr:WXG100 family type VII secretion target [Actinomycetaceae bacterium]